MKWHIKTLLERINRPYCWVNLMTRPIFEGSIMKTYPLRIRMLPDRQVLECTHWRAIDSGCPHPFILSAGNNMFDRLD